ncbi:hypothetical protein KUCAC02_033067 [Chaenocephalus aceratus]|nr:hypothetical protein KUCAC02_033067 [Chaenocephalus aceratus]
MHQELDSETRLLIDNVLGYFAGLARPRGDGGEALVTMKRVVFQILEKHQYAFNGMISGLSSDESVDDVIRVASELFGDGITNWGRIVTLVAFGAVLSRHLKDTGRAGCVEPLGHRISTYLLTYHREWLVNNAAWEGFVEFFRTSGPVSTFWTRLGTFFGLRGGGPTGSVE